MTGMHVREPRPCAPPLRNSIMAIKVLLSGSMVADRENDFQAFWSILYLKILAVQ